MVSCANYPGFPCKFNRRCRENCIPDPRLQAAEHVANTIEAAHPDKPRPNVTTLAKARNDLMVIPTATGDQLVSPPQW